MMSLIQSLRVGLRSRLSVVFTGSHLLHTARFLLAFLLGYGFIFMYPNIHASWILVTVCIVMTSNTMLGLQINKIVLRSMATVLGAGLGMIALSFPHSPLYLVPSVIVCILFFLIIAPLESSRGYITTLGVITFSIVTFSTPPTYAQAILRVIDIFIGCGISLFVSLVFFPIRSKYVFVTTMKTCCEEIANMLTLIFIEHKKRREDKECHYLDELIKQYFAKTPVVFSAMHYESRKDRRLIDSMKTMTRYLYAIYQYLLLMDASLWDMEAKEPLYQTELFLQLKEWVMAFSSELVAFFDLANDQAAREDSYNRVVASTASFEQRLSRLKNDSNHQTIEVIDFCLTRLQSCLFKMKKEFHGCMANKAID